MFDSGTHNDLKQSLESVGACIAIFEIDDDVNHAKLITANSMFEQLASQPISSVINNELSCIFERYILNQFLEAFEQCSLDNDAKEQEIVVENNGESQWWRFVFSPILSHSHRSNRILVTAIDITDRILLERQLKSTSERFEAVVESAYDGIITIDEKQQIKLINSSAKEIFKTGNEEMIGKSIETLIPQRFRAKHPTYINNFKHSEIKSRSMQSRASVTGLRRDGSEFPVEVTISKIQVSGAAEMTAVV